MSNKKETKQTLLAIDPVVRGFGYAMFEAQNRLIDWGLVELRYNKNARTLLRIKELIRRYEVDVVILEKFEDSRRRNRVCRLLQKLQKELEAMGITVLTYSREQVLDVFDSFGNTKKHDIAHTIATWLPELSHRLPERRKFYETESDIYGMYDAAAFAITHYYLSD